MLLALLLAACEPTGAPPARPRPDVAAVVELTDLIARDDVRFPDAMEALKTSPYRDVGQRMVVADGPTDVPTSADFYPTEAFPMRALEDAFGPGERPVTAAFGPEYQVVYHPRVPPDRQHAVALIVTTRGEFASEIVVQRDDRTAIASGSTAGTPPEAP